MAQAGISGPYATPKGLRHGFGVKAAADTRNPRLVQKWLGRGHLKTPVIYMDAVGDEERELAARIWQLPFRFLGVFTARVSSFFLYFPIHFVDTHRAAPLSHIVASLLYCFRFRFCFYNRAI